MTTARVVATFVLAVACGGENNVLTDTSAAGSSTNRPAATEQARAAKGLVESALRADTTLRGLDFSVAQDNDQIVLDGTVRTAQQKTTAEEIATRAAGGLRVVNRVRVE